MQSDKFIGAPCTETDPEVWFAPETRRLAVDLCRRCPAINECLELSISDAYWPDSMYGVWGGLPANARIGLRRKRKQRDRDGIVTFPTTSWDGELARSSA